MPLITRFRLFYVTCMQVSKEDRILGRSRRGKIWSLGKALAYPYSNFIPLSPIPLLLASRKRGFPRQKLTFFPKLGQDRGGGACQTMQRDSQLEYPHFSQSMAIHPREGSVHSECIAGDQSRPLMYIIDGVFEMLNPECTSKNQNMLEELAF